MKSKRILLIGGNFSPELTGIGKYNGEMVNFISENGGDCSVITTFPYYPQWEIQHPYKYKRYWFLKENVSAGRSSYKIYRCPHYVPSKPTGVRRIFSDVTFTCSALLLLATLLFRKKYDYVITVVPSFQIGFLGLIYKFFRGAKLIYHVQDLQIDAARELGMIRSTMLLDIMFASERFILNKSDYVSSISEGMIKKIRSKCNKPVFFFPNWVDTKGFYPIEHSSKLKQRFGFDSDETIILYSGAIGEKQGLEFVLNVAKMITRPKLKFVICGSGPYKEILVAIAKKMGLQNVIFLPVQPKEMFNQFLNIADVHLVPQRADAVDLVMPSKLSTIFSIGGLAVISATEQSGLYNMISKNNIGILVEPDNESAMKDSILQAIDGDGQLIRTNAREFALQNLSCENVIVRFLAEVMPDVHLSPYQALNKNENRVMVMEPSGS